MDLFGIVANKMFLLDGLHEVGFYETNLNEIWSHLVFGRSSFLK